MQEGLEPQWLSVKDLMTLTGLGRTKCYEMVAEGEFEAIKVGRAIRVSKASYEEWCRRNRYADYYLRG
jgi:excisionase family DNA binding protein